MNKNKAVLGIILIIVGIVSLFGSYNLSSYLPAWSPAGVFNKFDNELQAGQYCTVRDEKGGLVTKISRQASIGDEIFTADGCHYQITKVKGNQAWASFNGPDKAILGYDEFYDHLEFPVAAVAWRKQPIGVYHTHSDESYLPSDGASSIPFRGGIYQVGEAMVKRLKERGVKINYDKTPHDPHDNNAYYRSRRTAAQLIKNNPIALFDVHRDGIPDPSFYGRNIAQKYVAQVRFVIGRENPHYAANLDFAKLLMAYANKVYKPIVKDIYLSSGNFNQDLMPTAILIEAGTYTNVKTDAAQGISMLAEAVPVILGLTGPRAQPGAPENLKPITDPTSRTPGSWKALTWIVGLTFLAGGAFLIISAGGWDKAKNRLTNLVKRNKVK
jgi:stage II sporulation protein P